jgi:hypothetical protein
MPDVVASALDDRRLIQRRHVMTDAINAKSDVLGARELDAVSGGLLSLPLVAYKVRAASKGEGTSSGQSDPAQMFQQILQQLTQGR